MVGLLNLEYKSFREFLNPLKLFLKFCMCLHFPEKGSQGFLIVKGVVGVKRIKERTSFPLLYEPSTTLSSSNFYFMSVLTIVIPRKVCVFYFLFFTTNSFISSLQTCSHPIPTIKTILFQSSNSLFRKCFLEHQCF